MLALKHTIVKSLPFLALIASFNMFLAAFILS